MKLAIVLVSPLDSDSPALIPDQRVYCFVNGGHSKGGHQQYIVHRAKTVNRSKSACL
jgi:hypothetical protein